MIPPVVKMFASMLMAYIFISGYQWVKELYSKEGDLNKKIIYIVLMIFSVFGALVCTFYFGQGVLLMQWTH